MTTKQAQRTPTPFHKSGRESDPWYDFYKGWRGQTAANAVRLAIADHLAQPFLSGVGSTEFTTALRDAERRCNAYDAHLARIAELEAALRDCIGIMSSLRDFVAEGGSCRMVGAREAITGADNAYDSARAVLAKGQSR